MILKNKKFRRTVNIRLFGTDTRPGQQPSYDVSYDEDRDFITTEYVDKSSVKTPNFRALVKAGSKLPENPFEYMAFKLLGGEGVVYQYETWPFGTSNKVSTYSTFSTGGVEVLEPTISKSAIDTKLISRAKGNQWNAPVFLAEAKKTGDMVVQRATHIAKMALALKKGRITEFVSMFHDSANPEIRFSKSQARKFGKNYGRDPKLAASNAWLEYSYGWVPFVSDVRSAMHTLMDTVDKPINRISRLKTSITESTSTTSAEDLVFADGQNWRIRGRYELEVEESARAIWYVSANPADVPGRFGLLNPAEVVWELVPFSFVVDWFLPVGDYLAALDAPMRYTHHSGSYGNRVQTRRTVVPSAITKGYSFSGFNGSGEFVRVTRRRMGSIPSPEMSSLVPKFDLKVPQVASALALLKQQLNQLSHRR